MATRKFKNIAAFVDHFVTLDATADVKLEITAETTVKVVASHVKELFGNEERLAPLAASTIAEKKRLGYPTPFPLIRTGQLRESIEAHAEESGPGKVLGVVGSADPIMFFHETGTSKMPARPVLFLGATDMLPIVKTIAHAGAEAMAGGSVSLTSLFEGLSSTGESE